MAAKQTVEQEIQAALDGVVAYNLDAMFPKREGFGARRATRAMGRKGLIAAGQTPREAAS